MILQFISCLSNESIFNVNDIFMIARIKTDDESFTGSQNKDYRKRTVYRYITNNKRGIINIAVPIVSEQYVVVYRDPSLNIQMRRATSVGRYLATSDHVPRHIERHE